MRPVDREVARPVDRELVRRAARLADPQPADLLPADRRPADLLPADRGRALLGITGAPGSGKSTLAEALVRELVAGGVRAALVGMDGFHLAHRVLERLGTVELKGAPETFDAAGYIALLRRLRSSAQESPSGQDTVWAPEFRREIEDAVAGAVPVAPDATLVVTEGNYLLLDGPWRPVRELLDEVWFVDLPDEVRRRRLVARHRAHGRSEAQAWKRTLGSDERNATLIAATREWADIVVTEPPG